MKTKRKLFLAVVLSLLLSLGQVSLVSGTGDEPPPSVGSITVHKFNDANGDGVQGEGETDIEGWLVRLYTQVDGVLQVVAEDFTDGSGTVTFADLTAGHTWYKVWEEARQCWKPTAPDDIGSYDGGYYVLRKLYGPDHLNITVDFGNSYTCGLPGTGTPGYWKNHPEAWTVEAIDIGGVTYTKAEAIEHMDMPVKGDKTRTMFRALAAAKLNVSIGNVSYCIADTIEEADVWMETHGPVGIGVEGNSDAWQAGEGLYEELDAYNNGELCAPSRDAPE
jgi:hypothetical protein